MILEIFKDSLKYTFKNITAIFTIGILSLFSFLIIPQVLISGYLYRITEIGLGSMINTEMSLATDTELKFNNFKRMLKEGLKVIAIIFSYSLIPIIIITLLIINSAFAISSIDNNFHLNIPPELFLTAIILGLIASIFISVAIPHMIENKSLKSGFKIKELIEIIRSVGIIEYILYIIGSVIILISMLIILFLIVQLLISTINFILINILAISPNWSLMGINFDLVIYGLLIVLIIYPIYLIFQSRGMALIYETADIEEFEDE